MKPDMGTLDSSTTDTGVHPDAAAHPDATIPDSGLHPNAMALDSGVHPDAAAHPDATIPDSGVHPDAVVPDIGIWPDATIPDTGEHPDATISDFGVHPDAMVVDLGTPDTGVDAGTGAGPITYYVVEEGGIPYTAQELQPGGNPNYPQTNGYIHIDTLPFEFELFGTTYPRGTRVSISSHGYLLLGNNARPLPNQNQSLASLNGAAGVIAPLWQPAQTGNKGMDVHVRRDGITVLWYNTYPVDRRFTSYYTLHIDGASKHIKFTYYNLDGHDRAAATIGIRGSSSTELSERSCSPNCAQTPFYEIVYHPNGRPPAKADVFIESVSARPGFMDAFPGEDVTLDITFRNRGGGFYRLQQDYVMIDAFPPGASIHQSYVSGEVRDYFGTRGHLIPPGGSIVHSWNLGSTRRNNYQFVITIDSGPADWVRSNDISSRFPDIRSRPWLGTCRVINATLPTATAGQPYSFQFTGSGCPNQSWSGYRLPSWATLDPTTGLLTATPTAPVAVEISIELSSADRGYRGGIERFPLVISP